VAAFCPQCGTKLEEQFIFGQKRNVCPSCSYVHFEDPKVAVGVVVLRQGRIVLGKRGHEPNYGLWSFPSGYVDAGEVLEDAARREVKEETGLDIRIDRLLGVYSRSGERTIFVAYAGEATGGELTVGEECLEVATFLPDELPELAFPHDDAIIAAWRDSGHQRSTNSGDPT
jgi:ADP-ribose pyrophosphatase YjhB (NUDIX family)